LFPIFLATFTKKLLKISQTSSCFVIKTSFSDKTVSFWFKLPLFVRKGLTGIILGEANKKEPLYLREKNSLSL
jgi:hypothetical protein